MGFGMVDAADGSNAKGQAAAVYVERKMDVASEDRIPSTLPIVRGGKPKSVPTRVIESGQINTWRLSHPARFKWIMRRQLCPPDYWR